MARYRPCEISVSWNSHIWHFVEFFFSSFSTLEFIIYNEKSLIDRLIKKELAIARVKKTRAEEPAKMR